MVKDGSTQNVENLSEEWIHFGSDLLTYSFLTSTDTSSAPTLRDRGTPSPPDRCHEGERAVALPPPGLCIFQSQQNFNQLIGDIENKKDCCIIDAGIVARALPAEPPLPLFLFTKQVNFRLILPRHISFISFCNEVNKSCIHFCPELKYY